MKIKPDPKEYGPKLSGAGGIKVIVSGKTEVKSSDPRVVVVRE